jgi:NAD(P)-dependent dehydrogenase (short-subunit alcohol dehydrogenase family)
MTDSKRTALVTGASSGLGFEAAAQLAGHGYDRVIVTARSDEKAKKAEGELRARTGEDVFETLILDNNKLDTVSAAVTELAERGGAIDFLLLNAGISPTKELTKTADGIEATFGASLVGHHLLTMRLLDNDLLADNARIVIAGSEAARGDVPTFKPVDIDAFAAANFGGDLKPPSSPSFGWSPRRSTSHPIRMQQPSCSSPGGPQSWRAGFRKG